MTSFIPNILVSKFNSAREYLTPVLTISQFYEKGQLTPEEFVSAGDYLVRLSPTWKWTRGDSSRTKPYLPPDKQFLILKTAPCRRRVSTCSRSDGDHDIISMFASEQVLPALPSSPATVSSVRSIHTADHADHGSRRGSKHSDDEYGDLTHFIEPVLNFIDTGAVIKHTPESSGSSDKETEDEVRLYELTIVYDNYYRTPRVYLCGSTNDGRPLGATETMEDIMQDYINKTATIEPHPHTGIQYISIHPCRHAETMKRIIDVMIMNNDGRLPSVNMYMFLFIKFIGSMIPTIEYDNTMPISVSN
jgi:ubiquitin-like-conjugating enzyme ATG3